MNEAIMQLIAAFIESEDCGAPARAKIRKWLDAVTALTSHEYVANLARSRPRPADCVRAIRNDLDCTLKEAHDMYKEYMRWKEAKCD